MEILIKRIAVIGGGRWAKVITEEICDILSKNIIISIHSLSNHKNFSKWVKQKNFQQKIIVNKNLPNFSNENIDAAFIVNAARDHEKYVKICLNAGVPTLVEKPITLASSTTEKLISIANEKGKILASSHVFLFADYLKNFLGYINVKQINHIQIDWIDSKSEVRYGEKKTYDYGLPIYLDCLPHILSIINRLIPDKNWDFKNLNLMGGGSKLEIEMSVGRIPCFIIIQRNGNDRIRYIRINHSKTTELDFSKEPGYIISKGENTNADINWGLNMRPLKKMISCFIKSVSVGKVDNRLSPHLGLRINNFIDKLKDEYRNQMSIWLSKMLKPELIPDENIVYALKEIFSFKAYIPIDILEKNIKNILKSIKDDLSVDLINQLHSNDNIIDILETLFINEIKSDNN